MARNRVLLPLVAVAAIVGVGIVAVAQASTGQPSQNHRRHGHRGSQQGAPRTATPIKHVVVIFQENESFDHYFGTYPKAANTDGRRFHAARGTPAVDGLLPATSRSLPRKLRHSTNLLTHNPNEDQPQRLDSSATGLGADAGGQLTCDEDHNYSDEQQAFDGGKMDHFVQSTGTDAGTKSPFGTTCQASQVMDYYDGNTVTAMWNYAQHYSLEDYSFGVTFGPSAPGAINVAAGDTGNVDTGDMANSPSVSTATSPDGDLTHRRQGWLLAHERRAALLGRLLDARRRRAQGQEHRRRIEQGRSLLGLVRGRLLRRRPRSPRRRPRPITPGSRHRSSFRTNSPGASPARTCPRTRPTRRCVTQCTRSAWLSVAPVSGATRTTTSRTTSRSSSTPRRPTHIT